MQQSREHLKSMLWGQPSSHVYAFVRGDVVPGLRERLTTSDALDWDCLWRGALPPADQERAPYVVALRRESALTDWLLGEAAQAYPDWGVVGVSAEPFLAVREQGRSLMQVQVPGGQVRHWTWLDPTLWSALLPQLDARQLQEAFGGVTDWVRIGAAQWQWLTLTAGQLQSSVRACAPSTGV